MTVLRIGDVAFHVEEAGQGEPLLLIHGTGGHADAFRPVLQPLSQRQRVIAYDRRGHSRSVAPPHAGPDYFAAHARDALALLRALGAAPARVLGWSAGGLVAMHMALIEPQSVRRLVLYEPPLHVKRHMTFPVALRFLQTLVLGALGFRRAAAGNFLRMALGFASGGNQFDRLPAAAQAALLDNAPALLAELRAGTGEELTEPDVQSIACPKSLIVGGNTPPFLYAAANRLIRLLPDLRVLRVPEAGHMLQVQDPARFVEAVTQALAPPAA